MIAIPREPADMSCDGVSNPEGPDASYNAHKGLGYMAQIVETYAEDDGPAHETAPRSPDLITHVDGRGMTVHDGQFARFQYTPIRAQNQKRRFYESSDAFRKTCRWRTGMTRPCHA